MPDARFPQMRSGLTPGTRLNGVYEIDQQIAAGGMGEIYRAHSIQTKDVVAIKMMLPSFAENASALALFRKEASALHNLHHEAIVRYYVFSVEPTLRRPYLAMEFVEGQTLSALLKRGPMVFEAVVTLMRRICAGLQAAHERGIVHRDVSPDNIIIPRGADVARAKIIDFGIARSTQTGAQTVIGGGFAGKYNYVSPEQLGLYGGEVTAKSDIYSLGLLLVEALTGRPIDMGGSQVAVLEKRRRVPDLGAIDMRIRPLIDRMLQPDPDDRPDSMAACAGWPLGGNPGLLRRRDADAASGNRAKDKAAIIAAAEEEAREPERAQKRRTMMIGGAAAAVLVLVIGAAVYYILQQPAGPLLGAPVKPAADLGTGSGAAQPAATTPPASSFGAPALSTTATPTAPPSPTRPPSAVTTAPPGATPPPSATRPPQATLPPAPATAPPGLSAAPSLTPPAPTLAPPAPSLTPGAPTLTPAPPPLSPAAPPEPAGAPMPTYTPPPLAPSGQSSRPSYAAPVVPPVGATASQGSPPYAPPAAPQLPQQQTASATPTPRMPPASGPQRIQQIEDFITQYEGGECFFIRPVAVSTNAAQIEGYGASVALFQTLDTAFKRSNGFEADIGVRQVMPAQCPAITFLSRQRFESAGAPRLEIARTSVQSGEILRGELTESLGRHVELLLVTDLGAVHNVSALLKPSGSGSQFSMGLQRAGAPGPRPQLLLALASAQPLATLREVSGTPASELFARLSNEITQDGQTVAVAARYFKLE